MGILELNWLALHLIPNLGVKTLQQLLAHYETVENLLRVPACDLIQQAGLSSKMANRIAKAKEVASYQMEQRLIEENAVEILCLESRNYPAPLQQISAPPPVLYKQGVLSTTDAPCIAIVGSRTASHYGKKNTRRLVLEIAELLPHAVIVSGLARGIDTIAHESALEAGLSTIAVLAGGLKHIYPPENHSLAEAIKAQGALISEFPLGLKPLARNFPIRNRIISGLSQGIVVTEAGHKSGALITAAFGFQHNREVFALPGSVEAPASQGTNRLIAQHQAKLITQAQDIVQELQISATNGAQTEFSFSGAPQPGLAMASLSSSQTTILHGLEAGCLDIDSLFAHTQIEINELLGLLVELELLGLVRSLPGQCYQLEEALPLP